MLKDFERNSAMKAVIDAARLCEQVRGSLDEAASMQKSDLSPVTVADFGAQALVLNELAKAFPDIPAVGEEDASDLRGEENAALRERVVSEVARIDPSFDEHLTLQAIDRGSYVGGSQGRFWTLDPIDGTKGFLRQDQYAVALALIEDGEPVFGILGCPQLPAVWQEPKGTRGCLFLAEKGKGCVQMDMQGKLRDAVRVDETVAGAEAAFCESVESGHSRHDWAASVAEKLGIARDSVRMDSQCKYAAIARGDASIYLRLPTRPGYQEKIWDHAAGWICVQQAGGHVTDIHGAELDFSLGQKLSQNSGVIATNGHLHDEVVAAVQATMPTSP